MPSGWEGVSAAMSKSASGELKTQLAAVSVAFGDAETVKSLLELARDTKFTLE
jgi:hypothetical protein